MTIPLLLMAMAGQNATAVMTDSVAGTLLESPRNAIAMAAVPSTTDSVSAAHPSLANPASDTVAIVAPVVPVAQMPSSSSMPPVPPVARKSTAERYGSWQVGFAVGGASGYGISARRWFGDANAIQLNLAPYLSNRNYPGTDDPANASSFIDTGFVLEASLSAGISWLHQVVQVPLFDDRGEMKVLSYLAASTYLSVDQQQMDRWIPDDVKGRRKIYDDYYRTKKEFRLGGGGGCEFSRWRMSTTLLVGLSAWVETTSEDYGVSPDAQWGVHFRF